jgi:hypothetical protein
VCSFGLELSRAGDVDARSKVDKPGFGMTGFGMPLDAVGH